MRKSVKDGTFQLGLLAGILLCVLLFSVWQSYYRETNTDLQKVERVSEGSPTAGQEHPDLSPFFHPPISRVLCAGELAREEGGAAAVVGVPTAIRNPTKACRLSVRETGTASHSLSLYRGDLPTVVQQAPGSLGLRYGPALVCTTHSWDTASKSWKTIRPNHCQPSPRYTMSEFH